MTTPKVSVLMPVYNAERYLREAVESILGQTFGDFEFIIVDDGSTDGSLAILREYERRDGRIRLLSRPNTGIVGALNDGIALARAPLLARMDADDWSMPTRFERQVQFLDRHPECVAVGTWLLVTDPEGAPIFTMRQETDPAQLSRNLLEFRGTGIGHATVIMRRDAVMHVGGYRKEYQWSEDRDLWLRLDEIGTLTSISEVLYRYRYHLSSVCHRRLLAQHRANTALVKDACRRRGISEPAVVGQWETAELSDLSESDHYRRWSRLASEDGHWRTARKYAIRLLLSNSFRRQDLWILLDACLGPRRTRVLQDFYRRMRGLGPVEDSAASG